MASARLYCPGCRMWFHFIDSPSKIKKAKDEGCKNCGSLLYTSEILQKPHLDIASDIPPSSRQSAELHLQQQDIYARLAGEGIPLPTIITAPEIEILRPFEKLSVDHSERILRLAGIFDDHEGETVGSHSK